MATRTRKCDRARDPIEPPQVECCPICQLPGRKLWGVTTICTFHARCEKVKLSENPQKSAKDRSQMYRQFHADICEVCRLPKEVCKENKFVALRRQTKKDGFDPDHIQGYEYTVAAKKPCTRTPNRKKYTPKNPDWYV